MVLVEALAAGRPVVAPAAGGPQEILTEAASTRPGDAQAAVAALGRPWPTPTRPPDARRRAEEHFDVRESTPPPGCAATVSERQLDPACGTK